MNLRRAAVAGAVAVCLLAACSGAPRPQTVAAGKDRQARAGDGSAADAALDGTVPGADPAAQGDPAAAGGGVGGTGGATGGGPTGTGGASGGGGGGTGGGTPAPQLPGGRTIRDANLFSGASNRTGMTNDKITLCGHAALIFASAFDTRPEDLNVYWQAMNDAGGVHGRKVEISYEDDQYSESEAVRAAEKCASKNPFMLLGGIGFDQIPRVRQWVEDNKLLYYHHIAVIDDKKQYSFTPQPSVQDVGRAFGEHIGTKYKGKRIGIVYRDSENWEPGRRAGKDELAKRGANVTVDTKVVKNQAIYTEQIGQLDGKADVVWIWENALAAAEFIKQSHNRGYHPTFVVFPFQTTLDLVGSDTPKSPIDGVATWPSHKVGGYGNAFAEHGYPAELKRFEDAMARYRPGVKPNDILWQTWLANKALHDLFNVCGRDCTRNRMAGIFLSGYKATVAPNCVVDFGRHPHRGGYQYLVHEAFMDGSTPWYRTVRWCSEHLG